MSVSIFLGVVLVMSLFGCCAYFMKCEAGFKGEYEKMVRKKDPQRQRMPGSGCNFL